MKSVLQSDEPKYAQIARRVRDQVRSGALKPGDKLPSYPEMRAQGVSQPTLDRVHALLERDGLISRERGRGVFVTRRPAAVQRRTIVCHLPRQQQGTHPYWRHLLEGVQDGANQLSCDVLLPSPDSPVDWAAVDGLLVFGFNRLCAEMQRPAHLPTVSLMLNAPGQAAVTVDERTAAAQLTRYLSGLGHRRIAYLACDYTPERAYGYREALAQCGIESDPQWLRKAFAVTGKSLSVAGYQAMKQWLDEDWPALGCTALLVHNDDGAEGVLRALREAGLRVPQDVSVVGFDGTEVSAHLTPPLTTMEVPLQEVGRRGLELLLERRANAAIPPAVELLPCALLVRDSAAPPPHSQTNRQGENP